MRKTNVFWMVSKIVFDVGKANTDHGVNYELMEKMKNGRIVAA